MLVACKFLFGMIEPQVTEGAEIIASHRLLLQKDQEHPEGREYLLYFCVSRTQYIAWQ